MEDLLRVLEEKGKGIILSLMGVIILLLGIVLWSFIQKEPKEVVPEVDVFEELLAEEVREEIKGEEDVKNETLDSKEIIVDVKGAVLAPGVYTMTENSRVIDAISKAGGLEVEAEEKAVNLAQILEDQMVIYIPKIGEEGIEIVTATQTNSHHPENTEAKININYAEKETLMTLNGIGPSKADSILSYREENGLFQSIEEIKHVSGIGDATFDKLKEIIMVD